VVSYNVENLFDDSTGGEEYPEYRGERWNRELFPRKLAAVARVLRRAAAGGPDIVALQEVESAAALHALRERLSALGYRYAVAAEQRGTVTTVAVLSRIPILRSAVHATGSFAGTPLRPILEVELEHRGHRLYLFNNHWKSKIEARGAGGAATAEGRRRAAEVLSRRLAEILRREPEADLVVVGDLNENLEELAAPGESHLPLTGNGAQAGLNGGRLTLYDPWFELLPDQRGSSVYRGRWETHDHVLLAGGLFDRRGFYYLPGEFRVLRSTFLLVPGGEVPRRWRPGAGAQPGYSDHLPLLLTLHAAR
jgi:endonuclease/exonuclease/phosphatase family metal-dependent hydrolase